MKLLLKLLCLVVCTTLSTATGSFADEVEELQLPQVYDLGGKPAKVQKKTPPPKPAPQPEVNVFVPPPPMPPPPPPQPRYDAPPAYRPAPPPVPAGEDSHFIQHDDYFIQRHNLDGRAWIYVDLAKMVNAPGSHTKGEAEFMKVRDAKQLWTSHYWQTRIAAQHELRLGLPVIMFEGNHRGSVYHAPQSKERARGSNWFMAKITDTSDLYKGYVTVSGNYKVAVDNLRVIIQ